MATTVTQWTNERLCGLIAEFREHAVLWNPKSPDFRDRSKKSEAWNDIARRLGLERYVCERKMNILRTQFRREWNKKKERSFRSNIPFGRITESKWYAYKSLNFLEGVEQRNIRKYSEGEGSAAIMERSILEPVASTSKSNMEFEIHAAPNNGILSCNEATVKIEDQELPEDYSLAIVPNIDNENHPKEANDSSTPTSDVQQYCPDIISEISEKSERSQTNEEHPQINNQHENDPPTNSSASYPQIKLKPKSALTNPEIHSQDVLVTSGPSSNQCRQFRFKRPPIPQSKEPPFFFGQFYTDGMQNIEKACDSTITEMIDKRNSMAIRYSERIEGSQDGIENHQRVISAPAIQQTPNTQLNPLTGNRGVERLHFSRLCALRYLLSSNSSLLSGPMVPGVVDEVRSNSTMTIGIQTQPTADGTRTTEEGLPENSNSEIKKRMLEIRRRKLIAKKRLLAARKRKAVEKNSGSTSEGRKLNPSEICKARATLREFLLGVQDESDTNSSKRDESISYGEHVGFRLRRLSKTARIMSTNLINSILFDADMGKFDRIERSQNGLSSSGYNVFDDEVLDTTNDLLPMRTMKAERLDFLDYP